MEHEPRDAARSLKKLISGNSEYVLGYFSGDISSSRRTATADKGQNPFAAIITCSDSRVIPEMIFNAGVGDIFVIRTAGNTVCDRVLGSVEYAVEHLGCKLVVVMGHTDCGAIAAALHQNCDGHTGLIVRDIIRVTGQETDPGKVCKLNVEEGVRRLKECFGGKILAVGAIYDIRSGKVNFLEGSEHYLLNNE